MDGVLKKLRKQDLEKAKFSAGRSNTPEPAAGLSRNPIGAGKGSAQSLESLSSSLSVSIADDAQSPSNGNGSNGNGSRAKGSESKRAAEKSAGTRFEGIGSKDVASAKTEGKKLERRKPVKKTKFRNRCYKKLHIDRHLLQIGAVALALSLISCALVLGRAAYRTIPALCTDSGCPDKDPGDSLEILTPITAVLLSISFVLDVLVLLCPGMLVERAFISKSGSMVAVVLVGITTAALVGMNHNDELVLPYYRLQQYSVAAAPLDALSANFTFSNFLMTAPDVITTGMEMKIAAYAISSGESGNLGSLLEISPSNKRTFLQETGETVDGDTFSAVVEGLEDETTYFIVLLPIESEKLFLADTNALVSRASVTDTDNEVLSDVFVDPRMYTRCHWSSASGCDASLLLHT